MVCRPPVSKALQHTPLKQTVQATLVKAAILVGCNSNFLNWKDLRPKAKKNMVYETYA
jgi:hypothetical protein